MFFLPRTGTYHTSLVSIPHNQRPNDNIEKNCNFLSTHRVKVKLISDDVKTIQAPGEIKIE